MIDASGSSCGHRSSDTGRFLLLEDYLDNDGIDMERPVKVRCTVTVKGSDITDFTAHPQVKGPMNCVMGSPLRCLHVALLFDRSHIPINHGCYRPVTSSLEGSVVNARLPHRW